MQRTKNTRALCTGLLLAGVMLMAVALAGCSSNQDPATNHQAPAGPATAWAASFATYRDIPVEYTPALAPYQVQPGLANVTNRDTFTFSPAAIKLLEQNGFVVVPNQHQKEFFMLYEINRYGNIPNFITTDSMLHNYHLFFSHLLRVVEREQLAPQLKELTTAMLAASKDQYKTLRGSSWENAALRNVAYFSVAAKLLDPQTTVPDQARKIVAQELQLINQSAGNIPSPLMNMGQNLAPLDLFLEDYTQYIPRGHYAGEPLLQSYFKTMMWYGRMTFRLKSEDETKSAVLITLALDQNNNVSQWEQIYQPTSFFVGKADDLSPAQYRELLNSIYGSRTSLRDLAARNDLWARFMTEAAKLEPPAINSVPVFDANIQPDREQEIKGYRFMGQRFTLDAAIFQRLIYREVEENPQGQRRMLPRGLDIPAAMGSAEAYAILEAGGEAAYAGYAGNMAKLQQYIQGLDQATRTQNLYWSWLYTLEPLLQEYGPGYPSFMQNQAWTRKNLNTYLASWTELKHDTILYAKQSYAEMGGGMAENDDRGYVEPNPGLYARLAALVAMTRDGLEARQMLSPGDKESLNRLEELALALKTISVKELTNTPLTQEEYDLIRSYGGQLEHFWLEALADKGVDHRSGIYENPAALVTDVATNPNGQVLEEATGHIFDIYVVVPVDNSLRIVKGGVYSHYEFPWPSNDRLTDQKWRGLLETGQLPPLAGWTSSFIAP